MTTDDPAEWAAFARRFQAAFGLDPDADVPVILFQIGLETLREIPKQLSKEEKLRVIDAGLVALMVELGVARWTGYDGIFPTYAVDKAALAQVPRHQIIRRGLMRRYGDMVGGGPSDA